MERSKRPLVLVTGHTGLLARAFTEAARPHYEILGVSRRAAPDGVICDLSKEEQVRGLFESHRPAWAVHAAAYSDVDGCERDPKAADESNIQATKFLSKACEKYRVPWIYLSTDYVFDGRKTSPYTEEDATAPVNIYGMTKLAGEHYAKNCGVSSVIVRTSWLFGPGENPHNFVSAVLGRFKKEKKIEVLDDQTDCPTSTKDLSEALIRIGGRLMAGQAEGPAGVRHDVFHVCNAGGATRHEMALRMKEWLGLKEVRIEKADASRIKGRLAVRPAYAVMSTKHYESSFHVRLRPWQESLKEHVLESALCAS